MRRFCDAGLYVYTSRKHVRKQQLDLQIREACFNPNNTWACTFEDHLLKMHIFKFVKTDIYIYICFISDCVDTVSKVYDVNGFVVQIFVS